MSTLPSATNMPTTDDSLRTYRAVHRIVHAWFAQAKERRKHLHLALNLYAMLSLPVYLTMFLMTLSPQTVWASMLLLFLGVGTAYVARIFVEDFNPKVPAEVLADIEKFDLSQLVGSPEYFELRSKGGLTYRDLACFLQGQEDAIRMQLPRHASFSLA